MTITTARIKKLGKHFEILVDLDNAIKFRKGESSFVEPEGGRIFKDVKKGDVPSTADLKEAFGTVDANQIAGIIVRQGEVLVTQDYRDAEQEKRFKQVVDFLSRNSVDPKTGNPLSIERIKNAIEQSHIIIKNIPVENQIKDILQELSKIIPIKLEMKRIRINIPAIHTGKAYGIIAQYKEEENWKNDGSLEAVLNIPAGIVMDFYDKLNSVTHGSAITEELKN